MPPRADQFKIRSIPFAAAVAWVGPDLLDVELGRDDIQLYVSFIFPGYQIALELPRP